MRNCIIIPQIVRGILTQMADRFPEEMEGRDGGHLIVQEVGGEKPIRSVQVKMNKVSLPEDDFRRYAVNAVEKAGRLSRLANTEGHVSSWQSRNPEKSQYGGAVVATGLVVSFSGLTEHLDEYLSIHIATRFNRIADETVEKIIRISKNPH